MGSNGYYSMNWTRGRNRSPSFAKPSSRQRRKSSGGTTACSETLARTRLLRNAWSWSPLFTLVPEFVGGRGAFELEVAGDQLRLLWPEILAADGASDPWTVKGYRYAFTFVRVRPSGGPDR